MSRLLRLLDSPITMLASRLSVAALGLVSAPIIAQSLGPSGRGETAAALASMYLVPIVLALGMPLEIRRRVLAAGDLGAVRTARRLALLTAIPAALVAWLLASTLLSALDEAATIAVVVAITGTPLMVCWMIDIGVVGAQRRFGAVALLQATQPLVYVGGIVLLFLLDAITVSGVLWSNFAGSVMTALIGSLLNRTRGAAPAPWRPVLRGSVTFYGAQASDAAYQRLDQVIMLPLIGSHQAGLYSVAVTIGTLPVFLAHAIAAPVFSDITRTAGVARVTVTGDALRSAFAVGVASALFLAAVSPWGVPFLFGSEFAEALPAVIVAIIGSIFVVVTVSAGEVLSARNKGLRLTLAQGAGLITCLALLFGFGPANGAIAAAIANASGILMALVVMLLAIRPPARTLVPRPSDVPLVVRRLTTRGGAA
ncbi:lipopolysaccharide biosynthesis protein [Rathayibacter tanaceti]|uniref:Oligosaccharide flippase family protein n=2 Tax=Rathayibacter tanaceti TaxID=1671680 RepID=A0A162GMY8_9MICO|nr:oligosaccharide flippase family protein [Rathayibacter tanaceti]KZX20168.1 Polysaccharide biosynthesis protein [Rathayibacter tanaceti]QHC54257.1 oligosaccharide flippase family protein [Rathayibacter tanaceti]TCO37935.1 O-antigen/teichoic acid export membrane protein [Rathayibacter tanaceti]